MRLISLSNFAVIALIALSQVQAACNKSIIIIGAGAAGLGAAKRAKAYNCDVTVLEARNRMGGRINTETMGTATKVDMGASWIHGIGPGLGDSAKYEGQNNPIYTIAQQNNIKTVATWQDEDLNKVKYYWWKGSTVVLDQDRIPTMSDKVDSWVQGKKASATISQTIEQSLADFNYGTTTDDNLIYQQSINRQWGQDYAADENELSAKYYDSNDQFNGAEHIFPDGYIQIINALSKDINIILNKIVTQIDYSTDEITVTTDDASTYKADNVIVTVPLGVLKANKITFVPTLSQQKTDAIQRLGMGVMDKLFLEFPSAFWTNDLNTDWISYVSDIPGQWVETLNIYKYTKKPILLMFNVGQTAKDFAKLTDAQLLASAMTAIKKWYPNAPNYVNYKRSSWSTDPFSLGSYPFVKAGATTNDCELYRESKSTGDKIYFAGDGTTCSMIGTVHGAYITGVDAVKSITSVSTAIYSKMLSLMTAIVSITLVFTL